MISNFKKNNKRIIKMIMRIAADDILRGKTGGFRANREYSAEKATKRKNK